MSVINTNVASLNAQRNLSSSSAGLTTSLQRLSSGLRINSAKDDAAGMAISERMTAQIRGSNQAARNANDGISLAQTAEGDLGSISNNLQRMRELSVQAANASNSDSDRAALQTEVGALKSEIDRVAKNSSFNGVKLLDGSFNSQTFQIGANNTENDRVTVGKIANARTTELGGTGTSFKASFTTTAAVSGSALKAGDVTLNGFQVGASVDGVGNGNTADSAKAKAAAINAVSAQSGVTATAEATAVQGGAPTDLTAIDKDASFSINGVDVGAVAAGTNAAGKGANLAAAINKISDQTGVTATADAKTGALTLAAKDGRNIELQANTGGATQATALNDSTGLTVSAKTTAAVAPVTTNTAALGASPSQAQTDAAAAADAAATVADQQAADTANKEAGTTRGKITLSSTNKDGIVLDGATPAALGQTGGKVEAGKEVSSVNSVDSIDISTAAGAQNALEAIDGALKQINDSRSDLGALQNRFGSVVSGLATTTENLSASRSRITDTDFASETANMTRSQILQQAGTAMLAQANQLPNSVMSLLRG
jgi:flagellin